MWPTHAHVTDIGAISCVTTEGRSERVSEAWSMSVAGMTKQVQSALVKAEEDEKVSVHTKMGANNRLQSISNRAGCNLTL